MPCTISYEANILNPMYIKEKTNLLESIDVSLWGQSAMKQHDLNSMKSITINIIVDSRSRAVYTPDRYRSEGIIKIAVTLQ